MIRLDSGMAWHGMALHIGMAWSWLMAYRMVENRFSIHIPSFVLLEFQKPGKSFDITSNDGTGFLGGYLRTFIIDFSSDNPGLVFTDPGSNYL